MPRKEINFIANQVWRNKVKLKRLIAERSILEKRFMKTRNEMLSNEIKQELKMKNEEIQITLIKIKTLKKQEGYNEIG